MGRGGTNHNGWKGERGGKGGYGVVSKKKGGMTTTRAFVLEDQANTPFKRENKGKGEEHAVSHRKEKEETPETNFIRT